SSVGIDAVSPDVDRVVVEDPAAKDWSYPVGQDRRVAFGETSQPGVYYVSQYAGAELVAQEAFAANLFLHDESMIAPNQAPGLPEARPAAQPDQAQLAGQLKFRRELWPLAAFAGLLLLLLEWLYAQRMAL